MLRLYPVKPIIPINLESFLSVIAQFMPSLLFDFSINHCNVFQCIFSRFQQWSWMYFIVSTFERNSSMGLASFLSTRLKYSRFPDLERGEVYGQHFLFYLLD
jgi:hypothetical protein